MQQFLIKVLIGVITSDVVVAKLKEILGELVAERLYPLIPVAVKAAVDQVIAKVPQLEGVVDLVEVVTNTRNELDRLIPDVDWGPLDGLIDGWRPKHG